MELEIIERRLMKSVRRSIDTRELIDIFKYGKGTLNINFNDSSAGGFYVCFPSTEHPYTFLGGRIIYLSTRFIFENKIDNFWRNGWVL